MEGLEIGKIFELHGKNAKLLNQIYLYFIKFELYVIFNQVILIWHNLCN